MKNIWAFSILLLLFISQAGTSFAQMGFMATPGFGPTRTYSKLTIEEGDPRALLGKHIKVVFLYDGMTVGEKSEYQYVTEKIQAYNKKKDGRGDEWGRKWTESRAKSYEPAFIDKFNEFGAKTSTSVYSSNDNAPVTLTVRTTWTEPGYNAFVAAAPSLIDVYCTFTDADGNILLKIKAEHVPGYSGLGEDFEVTNRITECYAKLGKDLVKKIQKKFKGKKK